MPQRASTTSAHLLAPLALIVCAVAVLAVIATSIGGDGSSSGPAASTVEDADETTETQARTAPRQRQPATYTVEPGDTLGAIAEETGVPVETLLALNPDLDPQALIAGQEILLRE